MLRKPKATWIDNHQKGGNKDVSNVRTTNEDNSPKQPSKQHPYTPNQKAHTTTHDQPRALRRDPNPNQPKGHERRQKARRKSGERYTTIKSVDHQPITHKIDERNNPPSDIQDHQKPKQREHYPNFPQRHA